MLFVFFLKGIAVGAVIAVPVGPVGVLCVRRTIFEGRLFGFLSGLGAASADTFFGIIAGFGLTVIADTLLDYQGWLRGTGGVFLVYLGLTALRKRVKAIEKPEKNAENLFGAYLSTFVLTITNPVTILAFLGIFAAVGFTGEEATLASAATLVGGVLCGSLLWWLGLSLGAGLFRKSFREIHLLWLNRGSGALLTLSGIGLLASLLYDKLA
ncbi:MAG: LysE family transporter [Alphaproteobacteria bacterium]|nr:LysE family transporter [Alphaproteobacteria bacterium]